MSIGKIGRMAMVANNLEARRRRDERGRFMGGEQGDYQRPVQPRSDMRGDDGEMYTDRRNIVERGYIDSRMGIERDMPERMRENPTSGGEGWFAWDGMDVPPNRYPPARYERPRDNVDRYGENITDMRTYERQRMGGHADGEKSREGNKIGFAQSRQEEEKHIPLEQAKKWVEGMEWVDPKTHLKKKGPRWTYEEIKQYAENFGVTGKEKVIDFFAAINAMYADYVGVATKYGLDKPEYYADLAKAFLADEDAEDGKIVRYYHYIADKDE